MDSIIYAVPVPSNRKKWVFIGIFSLAFLLLSWAIVSPYVAVYQLRTAVQKGDIDAISDGIDFPSIRTSMKQIIRFQMMKSMNSTSDDSGFAGLGALLADGLISQMIDRMITPEYIASFAENDATSGVVHDASLKQNANGDQGPSFAKELVQHFSRPQKDNAALTFTYKNWRRFIVSSKDLHLIWLRSGLATWRLSAIQVTH